MRKRNKWLKAMSIALSCAVLATTAPMNVLATEVSTIAEVQSVTVPVVLDLESKILSYDTYGTWKENVPLSIEVNGVRTELKKDGSSVNVNFKNGDIVKLIVSDDIELYSGVAQVTDSSVSVVAEDDYFGNMKYNINYDSILNNLVISGKYLSGGGGMNNYANISINLPYKLIAKDSVGKPLQGISITDNTIAMWGQDIFEEYSMRSEELHTWGDGNSLYYEYISVDDVQGTLIHTTDENGRTDTTYSEIGSNLTGGSSGVMAGSDFCGSGIIYANNGLVEIDTEYSGSSDGTPDYATLESLGVSTSVTPYTDSVLGDYYKMFGLYMDSNAKDTLVLKDENGNEIATVDIKIKDFEGNIKDRYGFYDEENGGYVLTSFVFVPDTTIKMAEGMEDWNITTSISDGTFHINAVKTVSTDDDNTQDDTTQPDDTNKPEDDTNTSDTSYEVTLPADKTTISKSDFAAVLEANKTKDVVIKSNNNITFTFAKGTMANVDGMENYDFGSSVVSDFANAGNMGSSVTKDNFVTRINYNYSGKLPAKAEIKIYVGTDYANQTLYYSKIVEDGFKLIQSVKVDKDGYITITQDSCSDYVVTTNKLSTNNSEDTTTPDNDKADETPSAPKTGDNSNIFTYVTMLVCGLGAVFMAMQKKLSR